MSKYEQGAKAEFVVAEMLKSDGWYIANASSLDEIAGDDGAPLVRGADDAEITPDILAMKDGRTAWVEVKLKTSGAEWIHKNDQYEHFIDGKNWNSYLNIESSSGCEVWLAVIEQPEQTLRRQLIEDISVVGWWSETDVKQCNGTKYGESGVFLPQSDFMPIDLPADLAGEISEQRQLNGTVEPDEEVLPDFGVDDSGAVDDGQRGLGDFATDGGDDTDTEADDD
jgi:hypothetical protein